jgi:hypothetical protein
MNTIATRLQVGTAAFAIAAATTLVPVAAQAAPEISAPTAPITQVLGNMPEFTPFWFSTPNPDPAPRLTIFSPAFPVLGGISRILDPVWAALGLNGKELCILGADIQWGAYGGFTIRLGAGC